MDGMELSEFLHDNYPDILIVIFSGFGEFEYAKKAIRYNVSEYMLKPVTAMELTKVLRNMKEKAGFQKKNRKNGIPVADFKGLSQECGCHPVESTGDSCKLYQRCTGKSSGTEKLGISFDCSSYRVAVFDMDTYSEMYQVDMHKQQESALMSFVLLI